MKKDRNHIIFLLTMVCCLWSPFVPQAKGVSQTQTVPAWMLTRDMSVEKQHYLDSVNSILSADPDADRFKVQITDCFVERNDTSATVESSASLMSLPVTGSSDDITASALDAGGIISIHVSRVYTYESVDGNNQPVRLSAVLYTPSLTWFSDLDKGFLCCHPTTTEDKTAPSGSAPMDWQVCSLVSEEAFVVCPDYCGYGTTSNMQHPYLIQDVTAHNCIDAYLAGYKIVTQTMEFDLEDDFYTVIFGYSQGGSVALASLKYIESGILSDADVKKINVKQTFCGDGPYSPPATMDQWLADSNSKLNAKGEEVGYQPMAYACVLPLIMMAAKNSYDKDCMRTVTLEDIFTEPVLKSEAFEVIKEKTLSTDDVDKIFERINCKYMYQIFTDNILVKDTVKVNGQPVVLKTNDDGTKVYKVNIAYNTSNPIYKCLRRALTKNDLTFDWVPKCQTIFVHEPTDPVVPYCNMKRAKTAFGTGTNNNISYIDGDATTSPKVSWPWSRKLENLGSGSAIHVNYGKNFYIWFLSGANDMRED